MPETLIATPRGECVVDDLRAGDRVVTRDTGLQRIAHIGRRMVGHDQLAHHFHLQPLLVEKGSLGHGLPLHDMLVSPNQRFLVASGGDAQHFASHEALVAARHLAGTRVIRPVVAAGVTYLQLHCDHHQAVLVNGVWVEAFQPGDYSLNGLGDAQRYEIFEIFPDLIQTVAEREILGRQSSLRQKEKSSGDL